MRPGGSSRWLPSSLKNLVTVPIESSGTMTMPSRRSVRRYCQSAISAASAAADQARVETGCSWCSP